MWETGYPRNDLLLSPDAGRVRTHVRGELGLAEDVTAVLYATERSRPATGPGVTDVSYYRDVRELILAADVLVTDYSSVMFDFALTGKPIVFYAYDLHRFRKEIRGFYFDRCRTHPDRVLTHPGLS